MTLPVQAQPRANDDLVHFLTNFAWFAQAVDLSLDDVVRLLSSRFLGDFVLFQEEVFLNSNEARAEEKAICELLARTLLRHSRSVVWGREPGRDVDWCRTWLEAPQRGPGMYANVVDSPRPDGQLIGALQTLAGIRAGRLGAVRTISDSGERVARLRRANSRYTTVGHPWTEVVARRLRHVDPEAARDIETSLALRRSFHDVRLRNLLLDEAKAVRDGSRSSDEWRSNNADTLFEWTTALALCKAAVDTGWKPEKIKQIENSSGPGYPDVTFAFGNDQAARCRISKGRPRGPGDKSQANETQDDELSALIKATGNGATGSQPDIVVTFWRTDGLGSGTPEFSTYIGDAKRNVEGDGRAYLAASISKALVYSSAFSGLLRNTPHCTLFLYQGVKACLGVGLTDEQLREEGRAAVVAKLADVELPKVLCLDLPLIGDVVKAGESAGGSPVLKAYFERLVADARVLVRPENVQRT